MSVHGLDEGIKPAVSFLYYVGLIVSVSIQFLIN